VFRGKNVKHKSKQSLMVGDFNGNDLNGNDINGRRSLLRRVAPFDVLINRFQFGMSIINILLLNQHDVGGAFPSGVN
jgi:hypothetical protein